VDKMVIANLSSGNHTIEWSIGGYTTITATISISTTGIITCSNVIGGSCGNSISIIGNTITGLLVPSSSVSFNNWVTNKGGPTKIKGNLLIMGEFIDGYFGSINIGFSPTLQNMGLFIDYYFGV